MVGRIRNIVMAGTFLAIAAGNAAWDLVNSYFACILALAASFAAGLWLERAFIRRAHREMTRLHGADWRVGDR
ncbi:hypothetical protein SAMN05216573_117124 [Bradyrhizobium sp. Rc3b]|uniref:hypothetical protein n=1 Tax=Bradyrhizobium sp. Rc3b TaxID=1855322 RepID=UPI0008E4802B|nr:hypothetical protein [Bradyrhizobium sp. Rc3b]SFN64115.1 hypothetical protein SAMN05216573_117124 [Bradyrhizobium sp. Rc3b]